jgi:hypothetical protein
MLFILLAEEAVECQVYNFPAYENSISHAPVGSAPDFPPRRVDSRSGHAAAVDDRDPMRYDAHHAEQMRQMSFGAAQARRGRAEKQDIVNAWPVGKLLASLR